MRICSIFRGRAASGTGTRADYRGLWQRFRLPNRPSARAKGDAKMKRRAFLLLFGLLLIALLGLAWSNRFCLDDAYISFRYAHNLIRGRGLVYNEGERVEGYTNFLWVLLVSAGMWLGFDPVVFSQILGMMAFGGSLLLTYRMATDITDSKWLGLVAMLVLGTNYSFSSFATGGLETSLQACLLTGSVCVTLAIHAENGVAWPRLVACSSLLGFAMLTHPDSVLFVSLLPIAARQVYRERTKIGLRMLALLGPFFLLTVPWLAWKVWYYGDILPNTFYAKATGAISVRQGLDYVWRFLWTYNLWPFGFLALLTLPTVEQRRTRWLFSGLIVIWLGYVIWVGGDSMEYRFLVPVLPLAFVLITWLATRYARQRAVQITLIGMVLWGSLSHTLAFAVPTRPKVIIEPIKDLGAHVETRGWEAAGRKLGEVFGPDSDVVTGLWRKSQFPRQNERSSGNTKHGAAGSVPRGGVWGSDQIAGQLGTESVICRSMAAGEPTQRVEGSSPGAFRLYPTRTLSATV